MKCEHAISEHTGSDSVSCKLGGLESAIYIEKKNVACAENVSERSYVFDYAKSCMCIEMFLKGRKSKVSFEHCCAAKLGAQLLPGYQSKLCDCWRSHAYVTGFDCLITDLSLICSEN